MAWLKRIGCGLQGGPDQTERVSIPPDMRASNLKALIDFVFPPLLLSDPNKNVNQLRGNVLLTTTNSEAERINDQLLASFAGAERTYNSLDSPINEDHPEDALAVNVGDRAIENIIKKTPGDLPPHTLRLKVGSIVMIIVNVSVELGLCNGTRVQV